MGLESGYERARRFEEEQQARAAPREEPQISPPPSAPLEGRPAPSIQPRGIGRRAEEYSQRMAQIAREMAARQEEIASRLKEGIKPPQEEMRPPGVGYAEGSRPFADLRESVLRQAAEAAGRKKVTPLTPEQRETMGRAKQAEEAFGKAGKAGFRWGEKSAEAVRKAVPLTEIPESGFVTQQQQQQLEGMSIPSIFKRTMRLLGEEGFERDVNWIEEQVASWDKDPLKREVMEAVQKVQPVKVKDPDVAAHHTRIRLITAGIDTPEKWQVLQEMTDVYERIDDFSKRLTYFSRDAGKNRLYVPGMESGSSAGGAGEEAEIPSQFFDYDKKDLEHINGKTFAEIYQTSKVGYTGPLGAFGGGENVTTTDLIARALDPRYAAYAATMDMLGRPAPAPTFGQELGGALAQKAGWVGEKITQTTERVGEYSRQQAWYNPLKYIAGAMEKGGKIALGGGKLVVGFVALLDELITDAIGFGTTLGEIIAKEIGGLVGIGEGATQEDYTTLGVRGLQTAKDIMDPLPIQYEFGEKGSGWEFGSHAIHIPQGAWTLPEELREYGFKWSDNPWLDMVVKEVLSLQWLLPGATQAGQLRRGGSLMDKLSNYSDELADAAKALFKAPSPENLAAFRRAFASSGIEAKIVAESRAALEAGDMSDWVKDTARVLAKVEDERQLAKIADKSMRSAAEGGIWEDMVKQWDRISGLKSTGRLSDEALRAREWGKWLDEQIVKVGNIPTRPGPITRFPTTHKKAYETMMEGITGEAAKSPLTYSLRQAYARMHPHTLRNINWESAEAPGQLYGYLLNQGVTPVEANRIVKELVSANPLDRGDVVRMAEEFLAGDRYAGLSRAYTFSQIQKRLPNLAPVLDPSDARRLAKTLDEKIALEDSLYDSILAQASKVFKTPDDLSDAMGTSRDLDVQFKQLVKSMRDGGHIPDDVADGFLDQLKALGKSKAAFKEEVKGVAGKLERFRMAGKRGGGEYQAKVKQYGKVDVIDENTGKKLGEVSFDQPLTTKQLNVIGHFDRDALKEIYRFHHKDMTAWLKTKDFSRKFAGEVETALNRLSMKWKKWLIYPRSRYVMQTYLSGTFKSMLMGAIDPSDMRAYNRLIEKGFTVLDNGIVVKLSDDSLRELDAVYHSVMGKTAYWRAQYTGSWLVGDSVDDPVQAVTNFMNQYLADDGVRTLLKQGDDAFLDWLQNTEPGNKMLRTWKPVMGLGDDASVADDYLRSLKELFAQTQDGAPGAYRAMLYSAGVSDDVDDLPDYFKNLLKKKQARIDADAAKAGIKPTKANISRGDISKYLAKQGANEQFHVPMVKHPFWSRPAKPKGKVMSWLEKDAESLYDGIFFRGANTPRKYMFKSMTMDYAKQLMGQGVDADNAIIAAARHAERTVNELLLDFSRKMAIERKLDWMSPFLAAFRLDLEAWIKMAAARPGIATMPIDYYITAYQQNQDLPSYLRWSVPIKIGGGRYNLNMPMVLLAPWAYSMPTGGSKPPYEEIMQGFMGPIPRAAVAEVKAIEPRKRKAELEAELARGNLSVSREREIARELEKLEWQTRGAWGELSSAFMSYPKGVQEGWLKGTLKDKIGAIPEDARKPGWTEPIFETMSEGDKTKIRKLMGKYTAYHEGKGMADRDEAFLWAVEQLSGEPFLPGPLAPISGAASGLLGKITRPSGTYYPEEIQEGFKRTAQSYRGEREPYWTDTMFGEAGVRLTPYEQQRQDEERRVRNIGYGMEQAQRIPLDIAQTREPERYPEFAGQARELPDWSRWSAEDRANRRRLADAAVSGGIDLGEQFGMRRPSDEFLESVGYEGGMPTEALKLYRQYEEEAKESGFGWREWLEKKAAQEKLNPAEQERLMSFADFYPYGHYPNMNAGGFWYGPYQQQLTQPYYDLIGEITRLRDLKGGQGATDMTPAEIDAQIARLEAQMAELIRQGMPIPNLTMTLDPDTVRNILRAAKGLPAEDKYQDVTLTTEELRRRAGLPDMGESTMPSPPIARLMSKGIVGKELDNYVQAMVKLTSTPYAQTKGKSNVEVDMKTAMLISGMTVQEIKDNRAKGGLGKPWYDEKTKKVYINSFPINWLDEDTQALIRSKVDDATWAKIMANAYEPGGGGGWRSYGGGYRRYGGYGGGGRGFSTAPSKSYTGPLTAEGESKADLFFTMPKSQRTAFLDANPDLKEWFRRQKEGESDADYGERMKLMELADRYYHIPDPNARRGFLKANPQLLAYFETLRQNKDKYFLKAMARAFSNNPELWEMYLQKQNELTDALIANLGRTYAERAPRVESRETRIR